MLITTKLQPPSLRSKLLYRKHLIQRLRTAKEYPLILLSGPGGSGKTSLICQWIKKEQLNVAWYSLDEEDNEPDLFFRYLLTSLARMDKRLDQNFSALLTTQQELEEKNVTPHIIESISNLAENFFLILDDFHNITNDEIHNALARLIQYIPAQLNLVILSRYQLPTPMDAAAIKKERLQVSAPDLKFTEKETSIFFKQSIPLSFSSGQIHDLNLHVEGWAAGLQLIALSVRSKGRVTDLSYITNQAHEQVANYLIHDILRMQSEKVRNFIFATTFLDRFNPELCIEITGTPDAARILARLTRMNFFLIPLETGRKWYRYHHMFAEVIRQQVSINNPDLMVETLRRAATWFAQKNYLEDAFRSAFKSKDFEFAADLMEDHLQLYIDRHDPAAGLRWISRLPDSVLNQRGFLRLQQCGFLLLLMQHAEVKQIVFELKGKDNPAFKRYSGPKQEFCREFWSHHNCLIQIFYAEKIMDAAQLLDLKNKLSPQTPILSVAIEMLMVFIFISKGELTMAEQCLAKISELTAGHKYMRHIFYLNKARALIARHQGRLHKAEMLLIQALELMNRKGKENISTTILFHRHLAYIFYLQNKLEKAREHAGISLQQTENDGLFTEIKAGYELQLLLHLAAGETEKADQRIQEIKTLSVKFNIPQLAASAEVNTAKLALEQGCPAIAEQWSQQRNLELNEPFSLLFAVECMTLARLFYARGQYSDAAHTLKTLRNRCQKRGLLELVLQIDILHSAVLHALGRRNAAISLLQQTLAFSMSAGYVRPYANDAGLIAPILKTLAGKQNDPALASHYKTVLTACNIPLDQPDTSYLNSKGIYGVLTRREIEILTWMIKGDSNKEIAHQAFISVTTVKTHVSRILSKLGVKTRVQAIAKAKAMNLLEKVE